MPEVAFQDQQAFVMDVATETCLMLDIDDAFRSGSHSCADDAGSTESCKASVHDRKAINDSNLFSLQGHHHGSILDFTVDVLLCHGAEPVPLLQCSAHAFPVDFLLSLLPGLHVSFFQKVSQKRELGGEPLSIFSKEG